MTRLRRIEENALEMPEHVFEVHFANGKVEVAPTFEEADDIARRQTSGKASPNLVPVEIWEIGPGILGVGRLMKTIEA